MPFLETGHALKMKSSSSCLPVEFYDRFVPEHRNNVKDSNDHYQRST